MKRRRQLAAIRDLRLTTDQEKAVREAVETGEWHPETYGDYAMGQDLVKLGVFARWPGANHFDITAAGRDWLATHPTEVAR